jgi:hypothetical protein
MVIARHLMAFAAFLVQAHPTLAALGIVVLDPHLDDSSHATECVNHRGNQGAFGAPGEHGAAKTSESNRPNSRVNEKRSAWIAERAYFRAEARGFRPGEALGNWVAAEAEVAAEEMTDRDKPVDETPLGSF